MKIRIRTIYRVALFFAIGLAVMIAFAATLLEKEKHDDVYHLEAHISQLVTLTTLPYLERGDLEGLQRISDEITKQPGILYLTIEKGQDVLAHSHSSRDPTIKVTTVSVPIEKSPVPNVEAVIGFQAQHFESASSEIGQIIIFSTVALAIIAIFSIYFMMVGAMRPLKRLNHLQGTDTAPQDVKLVNYADDISATVEYILNTKDKLDKSYAQLEASLKEQKYSYIEARQIEEQSEAIYKASHDAIIVANDQGIIIEFSPVAEQIFGWDRDDIVGKSMAETIVPTPMRDMHIQGMRHFLKTGEGPVLNQRIELSAIRRSGREFPIEISISAAKTQKGHIFVSYIRDISQRLQNQTELKIAAHAFDTSQPVFIADNKGHIIRSNPAFSNITGYQSSEVAGKKPRSLTANPEDLGFHKKIWRILNSQGSWEGEMRLRHKAGHNIPVFMSITSITDENSELSHYVAHFFDLTEQKRGEAKLKEMQQAAENANKAKSHFLAAMSHEIRTPMNGVLGVLGLLKETELDDLQKKLVKTARESGELLLAIINDILDFSKMEAGKLSLEDNPFNMYDLFEHTVDIVYPQAENKNLQLTSRIADGVPKYLVGDGDRVRQILLNLLSNAVKYTNTGTVNINLQCLHRRHDSVQLQVDVKDTGIGIDQKHIPTLFEEFTMAQATYSRTHEGSGLGLAICRQLVSQMNGQISVISEVGKGSTFTFTIELAIADEQESGEVTSKSKQDINPTNISDNLRILVAEDNPANQIVLRTMMEFSGISVDIVSNGVEAVEAVSRIPYDIVLMDISMPHMDGMEATKRIRAMNTPAKDVVIVALTAHALRGDREHFIELGMDDFVSKPFTRQSILDCLNRWQPNDAGIGPKSAPDSALSMASKPLTGVADVNAEADTGIDNDAPMVDEATLAQLAKDTSAELVPELIEFYIKDARQRVEKIAQSADENDHYTLEFEAHTLGSSAAAHGNKQLCAFCRDIEKHCLEQSFDLAFASAQAISDIAEKSFEALETRAEKGFTEQ
ncbi:PAS domain S-box protein [Grimontia indica]|nr:PAS domain S-box protein [Grimontia indica]